MFGGYAAWNLFSSVGGDQRFGRDDLGQYLSLLEPDPKSADC
jgi:hypothetical protein